MGADGYPYDARPYSVALAETGFPSIHRWASGEWDEAIAREVNALLIKAIAHESIPLLGAFFSTVPKASAFGLLVALNPESILKAWRVWRLGCHPGDLGDLFEDWGLEDFDEAIATSIALRLLVLSLIKK